VIVVDASAIVAILSREPEFAALIAALERAKGAATSPIAICEAALGLRRKRHCSVAEAEADAMEFLSLARVALRVNTSGPAAIPCASNSAMVTEGRATSLPSPIAQPDGALPSVTNFRNIWLKAIPTWIVH